MRRLLTLDSVRPETDQILVSQNVVEERAGVLGVRLGELEQSLTPLGLEF